MVGFISKKTMAHNRWVLAVEQDAESMFITLPQEFLDNYDWQPGDTIKWTNRGDGSWQLTNTKTLSAGSTNPNVTA